ncbi:Gluconate transport-inducing protein [Coemansia erecta]|nr:Gluconate transport-inducing protein [Coemansia erecta]
MFVPTYTGYIETTEDALLVFEACRLGILKRRSRRLVESERKHVQSGSVFVWDEAEAGIRRWTDGRRWSPSRVSGCFLIYTELEPKPATLTSSTTATDIPLENGLIKKALSLYTTKQNKLHLICYYLRQDLDAGKLITPTKDPLLSKIPISRSLYPEIIPEMIQTLPVRQTQTLDSRRSSITLAAPPVDVHHSLSVQQIQRRPTADYTQSNSLLADSSRTAHYESPLILPGQPPLSRRCMTTSDSKEELHPSLLQNINAHSAATHAPALSVQPPDNQKQQQIQVQAQQTNNKQLRPGYHDLPGSLQNSSSFRSLSHPFLLDNSDLPIMHGSSTAPGSRRSSTLYLSSLSENGGGGSRSRRESESMSVDGNFKLPPISELLSITNHKDTVRNAASDSCVTEKTRMRYARNPWDRRPHGIVRAPQSLANYTFN